MIKRFEGQPPPDLRIVPRTSIVVQEDYDDQRSILVAEGTEKKGKFQDPIIVTPLDESRFLQLDGANRKRAIDILNLDWAVVQILNPYTLATLISWVHQTKIDLNNFKRLEEAGLVVTEAKIISDELTSVARLHFCKDEQRTMLVSLNGDNGAVQKAWGMKQVVDLYEHNPVRLPFQEPTEEDFGMAMAAKSNLDTFVQFPPFRHDEVLQIVRQGMKIPSGITRHLIGVDKEGRIDFRAPYRVLEVNFPLKKLIGGTQIELQAELEERIKNAYVNDYIGLTRVYSWPE